MQAPWWQWPDEQSWSLPHALVAGHAGAHAGGWQRSATQMRDAQSLGDPQLSPSLHSGAHPGAWHVPAWQCFEAHCMSLAQAAPFMQSGAQLGGAPASWLASISASGEGGAAASAPLSSLGGEASCGFPT